MIIKCADVSITNERGYIKLDITGEDDSFLDECDTLNHAMDNNTFDTIAKKLDVDEMLDYISKNHSSYLIDYVMDKHESDIYSEVRKRNIKDILDI